MTALPTVQRALLVTLGVPLAVLAGCGGGQLGGAGGAGGGGASGGAPGQDAGTQACQDQGGMLAWQLTPAATALSGTVVGAAAESDSAEQVFLIDAVNARYKLTLRAPTPTPFVDGETIEIRTAERISFVIQRTLEIRKDGAPVLYLTEAEQPALPPPVPLEIGDVSCAWDLSPSFTVTHHRLVARDDAGAAVTIDPGQQGRVGPFRIHNDVIRKFPPGIEDAVDVFRVAVVRDP